ncbi:hypothetical protein B0T26DRAFT_742651 [Lasiosphaeria miniovina]|uniref:Aminoglycoside phosphotransferase domain-containing protein n=1 Tax=Lasiosphaeria miniovina TaxID=1954250 RepID=A0AA40DQ25_9PEZI|nr:uncharacterized protein B0T26DRAFT_742651 [Lasiosphaeria miniovina]KAK0709057.1 hypothetical protein B0T26DRAFT_742651 [Lasiosphaeria miniovina]
MKNEAATVHQNPTFLESLAAWPLHPYPSKEGVFLDRLNEAHRSGSLREWLSSFHPGQLPCWLARNDAHYGSCNVGLQFLFSDGTVWLLRLPRVGKVSDCYLDEKVAMENPLGLGPFIIIEFMQDCVSLNDLLKNPTEGTRLLTENISDAEIEIIYRQMASFQLQLFKLDFNSIGKLDSPTPGTCFPTRPLTWKAHDILQTGGVDTFGDRTKGFSSTTDSFQYVVEQDWEQLVRQPNSAYGKYDATARYRSFKVLKSLAPRFVHGQYDRAKFKIICDDLGLANLMARSRRDLNVVGVVDLEWSYVGPAQLLGSAPWWLLMDRPTSQAWDCDGDGDDDDTGEPAHITGRYFRYLGIFKRVLGEEEAKTPGHENRKLSSLIQWSQESSAMWFHMLLLTGFNDRCSFPFTKLVQHVGEDEWDRLERQLDDGEYSHEPEMASRALVDESEPRLDIAQVAAAAKLTLGRVATA